MPLCTAFFSCLFPSLFPHLMNLNPSSLVHPHLKMILLVGVEILTKIIKPCRIKNYRSAQINELSLRKWTFARRLTPRVATRWKRPIPNARQICLMPSVPRLNEQICPKSYAGFCAVEQASGSKAMLGLTTGPIQTILTLLERWTTPTISQLARCLILEQEVLCGRKCPAVPRTLQWKWRLRPNWPRIPQARPLNQRHAQSTRANDQDLLEVTKKKEEPFGLTSVHLSHQFGFRDASLWCWRCGGWSAGSRRASRLKDPCGIPTKTGAAVVYRL